MHGASASRVIRPAESETLSMRESSMHENREIPSAPALRPRRPAAGRSGKACGHKPDANAGGKSDISIVPMKAGNKAAGRGADGYGGTVTHPAIERAGLETLRLWSNASRILAGCGPAGGKADDQGKS